MQRERLVARRAHEVLSFEHGQSRATTFVAGIGRFDDGRLAEVFLSAGKAGADLDTNARDSAILLSLLLQYGAPVETIRAALSREEDGSASGAVGALLDILHEEGAEHGGAQA